MDSISFRDIAVFVIGMNAGAFSLVGLMALRYGLVNTIGMVNDLFEWLEQRR